MKKIINITKKIARDEEGAVLVEYALLVALIALACIAAITLLGNEIAALFERIAAILQAQPPGQG